MSILNKIDRVIKKLNCMKEKAQTNNSASIQNDVFEKCVEDIYKLVEDMEKCFNKSEIYVIDDDGKHLRLIVYFKVFMLKRSS